MLMPTAVTSTKLVISDLLGLASCCRADDFATQLVAPAQAALTERVWGYTTS